MSDSPGRPRKIAFVVHTFDVGGLERSVAILANRLDRSKFQPLIVCMSRSGSAAGWIERDDVKILEIRKSTGNDIVAVRRFAGMLREERPDIVHSHNWGTLAETVLARRWAGVPVHVHAERGTVMGTLERTGFRPRLRSRIMNWSLRRCTAVITNAENTSRRIADACGFPQRRVTIVPNGVEVPRVSDPEARHRLRRELGIPTDAFVVGSVGRLVGVKNFTLAIDALCQPALRPHAAHLILVGTGVEQARLSAFAAEREIANRVHLVGPQSNIGDWLLAMDAYVNTSLSEGMSQSIVEAMAAGLPLVVTDVGDNAVLAGGAAGGSVVPSGNAAALSGCLAELAARPSLRQQRSDASKARYAENYDIGRMVSEYEAFYDSLIGRPAATGSAAAPHAAFVREETLAAG
ncbi:MAG: glycosyltransferase [Planctomyces sp.]|nr:glycosyltransferase [Planctomyces sp.]